MMIKRLLTLAVLLTLFGCGHKTVVWLPYHPKKCKYTYTVDGRTYCVSKKGYGYVRYGIASWYGPGFQGRRTASGEIYNMYKLTAAHKTLPLGTYVKVVNLKNGRSVIVKVNDRGPFIPGRIIDLSYEAAKRIGMLKNGTTRVKLTALGNIKNIETGNFYVQVGAFKYKLNAYRFMYKVKLTTHKNTRVMRFSDGLYRVFVGGARSYSEAEGLKKRLRKMKLYGSFIVRL